MKVGNEIRVGFFDSGVGGLILTVDVAMKLSGFVKHLLDSENITVTFVHLGDAAYVPYGNKDLNDVLHRVKVCVSVLEQFYCDVIVCACNTMVAACYQREIAFNTNSKLIFSLVDDTAALLYRKARLATADNENIISMAVLSTVNTMSSGIYQDKIKAIHEKKGDSRALQLYQYAPDLWVENIEKSSGINAVILNVVRFDIYKLLMEDPARKNKVIALACTHFPFYTDLINASLRALGYSKVSLISQGVVMAPRVRDAIISLINPKTRLDQHKERSMELDAIQIYSISTGSENVVYQSVIKTMYGAAIADAIQYGTV